MEASKMRKSLSLSLLITCAVFVLGCTPSKANLSFVEQVNADLRNTPSAAGGVNYYVCDKGDDTNDGRSESTPFQSFSKGMSTFNSMNAGDSVLFCRGGVFQVVDSRLFNQRCSAASVCTIADYGDVNLERPQLVAEDVNGLSIMDGGSADADGGYVVRNIILFSSTGSKTGIFIYNDADDVMLDNLHIQGFSTAVHSAGSGALNAGVNGYNDRLTLRNSTIIDNSGGGWLGGGNDTLIENNQFENNGFAKINKHNIYISSPGKRIGVFVDSITIRGNTLYKASNINNECRGVSLVAHGLISNLTIENNIIKEDAGAVSPYCWGIGVDPGNALDEVFKNVRIINNKLLNMGNIAIECSSCDGVIVDGNTIIDEGNVLRAGIKIPGKPEDTVKSRNVTISNNNIILSKDNGEGISIGGEHVFDVKNNVITQPETSTVECITKSGANLNTDTSSNVCQRYTDIVYIDSATVVDASEGIVTDPTIADSTVDSAEPILNRRASRGREVINSTETGEAYEKSTRGEYVKYEGKVTRTRTVSNHTETDETDKTTTSGDYVRYERKAGDRRRCRATSSTGECLMR